VLESAALRRAARSRDRARLQEAREALEDMRSAGEDIEAFDEADVRFHVALVRASGNEAMHLVMLALRDAVARHLLAALRTRPARRRVLRRLVDEHAGILDALDADDGDRAATLVEDHIMRFYRSLR
jgi:DNA-binding FadR family transcriptional regulator